ncbi:MAG: M3 family oligoendopeptidase [Oscillospiraceae bacterium]|jgi:M3 family oligoendopeptidase|nr:M3 family oligoendopeptidase [Oscillospiraceae bacterium]
MELFKNIPYQRPSLLSMGKQLVKSAKAFRRAGDYAGAREAFLSLHKVADEIETPYVIAQIRNTMNMADKFYEKEMKRYSFVMALVMGVGAVAVKQFLKSRFLPEFEKDFGAQAFRLLSSQIQTNGLKTVVEMIKEENLVSKYKKTAASCGTQFRGEQCNFYGLLKHMQSTDREERREAFLAWAKLYEGAAPALDGIYDSLVAVRAKKARKLGFASYVDYAYLNRMRFDYTAKDVAAFREAVKEHIVPVCAAIHERQKARLGVETLHYYDESLYFPEGNPTPAGTAESMLEAAGKMYHELSGETGAFFDFMRQYELFDLETRPNKHLGGYCTHLLAYQAPFIFANFNGTSADVDVLTHEAGHAFQAYVSSRRQLLPEYISSTSEINETHSMSMEFFTYPWMEMFFGEDAERYRRMHFAMSLNAIPYLASVDEFQEKVYQNPKMTAAERRGVWREIERAYLPWRDYDGNTFLEGGGFWMQKQHIFMYPFYYIEYALAQLCAYQYFLRSKENPKQAWEDYYRLCLAGGGKGYFELLREGNLKNPLDPETVREVVRAVSAIIGQNGV